MGDIGKEFFLARNFTGSDPYMGTHGIPVPTKPHELVVRTFEPGQGSEFRDFLRGKMYTGEPKPRPLPGDMANRVARLVNEHRRGHEGSHTAYIFQLFGEGGNFVTWSLEPMSSRAARFDPVKTQSEQTIREARDHGLKSEMGNLRIKRWHRTLHYTIYLTAFESVGAMNTWVACYSRTPLSDQNHHRRPTGPVGEAEFWFETMGWQELPQGFISRLTSEAKALVFPSAARQMWQALEMASGPMILLPITWAYHLGMQDDRHGPKNCVCTQYHAKARLIFCRRH